MSRVLAEHDDVSGAVFVAHGGYVFSRAGDSFAVAFGAEGDTATSPELIVNMGRCPHTALAAYARYVAESLEVGDQFQTTQNMFFTSTGLDLLKQRTADDIATLRREMTRRDWG